MVPSFLTFFSLSLLVKFGFQDLINIIKQILSKLNVVLPYTRVYLIVLSYGNFLCQICGSLDHSTAKSPPFSFR